MVKETTSAIDTVTFYTEKQFINTLSRYLETHKRPNVVFWLMMHISYRGMWHTVGDKLYLIKDHL